MYGVVTALAGPLHRGAWFGARIEYGMNIAFIIIRGSVLISYIITSIPYRVGEVICFLDDRVF